MPMLPCGAAHGRCCVHARRPFGRAPCVHSGCIPGGYTSRLLIIALMPLVLIIAMALFLAFTRSILALCGVEEIQKFGRLSRRLSWRSTSTTTLKGDAVTVASGGTPGARNVLLRSGRSWLQRARRRLHATLYAQSLDWHVWPWYHLH